jgi:hypothetical protein
MKDYRVAMAALALLMVQHAALAASVYKCKNEQGKVFFSDRQCAGDQTGGTVRIKAVPPPSGAVVAPERSDLKDRAAAADERIDAARNARDKKARDRKNRRRAQCRRDQSLLAKLESRTCYGSNCTVYAYTPKDKKGNRYTASEHEKQAKVKRLKSSIAKNC